MRKASVVVTGAAGQDGSYLCEKAETELGWTRAYDFSALVQDMWRGE